MQMMIWFRRSIVCFTTVLACCSTNDKGDGEIASTPTYAEGFSIKDNGIFKEVDVIQPYQDAPVSFKYLLVPKNIEVPSHTAATTIVRIPVDKIVCTSTSHIALLELLKATNALVGFPAPDLVSSQKTRERIDAGLVTDIGIDSNIDIEKVFALSPDFVMGYSITGDMIKLSKLEELGIPVVINGEYLEDHPLGRAEWIKFMACFFGKEARADSIFNEIEKKYNASKALAASIASKPTVITGILYGDTWFMPGGRNYAATILYDAGYQYIWHNDSSRGFIKPGFEAVYERGSTAEFWIGVGSFNSLAEMESAEKRYALFDAFAKGQVYTYYGRKGPTGGSEYFEIGYSRPDIIINDLIKIAHPELVPEHKLYFHRKLE